MVSETVALLKQGCLEVQDTDKGTLLKTLLSIRFLWMKPQILKGPGYTSFVSSLLGASIITGVWSNFPLQPCTPHMYFEMMVVVIELP